MSVAAPLRGAYLICTDRPAERDGDNTRPLPCPDLLPLVSADARLGYDTR
jgi:hypothetical protein